MRLLAGPEHGIFLKAVRGPDKADTGARVAPDPGSSIKVVATPSQAGLGYTSATHVGHVEHFDHLQKSILLQQEGKVTATTIGQAFQFQLEITCHNFKW